VVVNFQAAAPFLYQQKKKTKEKNRDRNKASKKQEAARSLYFSKAKKIHQLT
jgi:hypothetical protein